MARTDLRRVVAFLAGAGVVILYAAFWAARVLYGLVGTEIAFVLMVSVVQYATVPFVVPFLRASLYFPASTAVGFEVPDSNLEEVNYLDSRLPVPDVIDEVFMRRLLFAKFRHWHYEQEHRAFIQLEEEIEGMYYSDFSSELELKKVIVGDQSSVTRSEVSDALGNLSSNVEAFKARAGFTKFEVVRQKNNAMWA